MTIDQTTSTIPLENAKLNIDALGKFKEGQKPLIENGVLRVDTAVVATTVRRYWNQAFKPEMIEKTFETVKLNPAKYAEGREHQNIAGIVTRALDGVLIIKQTYTNEGKAETADKLQAIYDKYSESLQPQITAWREEKEKKRSKFKSAMNVFLNGSQKGTPDDKRPQPSSDKKMSRARSAFLTKGVPPKRPDIKEPKKRKIRMMKVEQVPMNPPKNEVPPLEGASSTKTVHETKKERTIDILCKQAQKRFTKIRAQKETKDRREKKPKERFRLKKLISSHSKPHKKGNVNEELSQLFKQINITKELSGFDEEAIFEDRKAEQQKKQLSQFNTEMLERKEEQPQEQRAPDPEDDEWDDSPEYVMTEMHDFQVVDRGRQQWKESPNKKRRRSVSLSPAKFTEVRERNREQEKQEMREAAKELQRTLSMRRIATEYTNSDDTQTDVEEDWSDLNDDDLEGDIGEV